jgi:hypothetical protein
LEDVAVGFDHGRHHFGDYPCCVVVVVEVNSFCLQVVVLLLQEVLLGRLRHHSDVVGRRLRFRNLRRFRAPLGVDLPVKELREVDWLFERLWLFWQDKGTLGVLRVVLHIIVGGGRDHSIRISYYCLNPSLPLHACPDWL